MKSFVKQFIKTLVPKRLRTLISGVVPRFVCVNTYKLKIAHPLKNLRQIDGRYEIKILNETDDADSLKTLSAHRRPDYFERSIRPRLENPAWLGFSVADTSCGELAYIAWIVMENIDPAEGFWLDLQGNQCYLKDDYCVPGYRHQGLHTRVLQERINYCVRDGCDEIMIGIWNMNKKGINYVTSMGFKLVQHNYLIIIKRWGIYQELSYFIRTKMKRSSLKIVVNIA